VKINPVIHKGMHSVLTLKLGVTFNFSSDDSSDFDFSNDDSCSSEEDEKVKHKQGNFTCFCLMGKSSRNISDSNSDVSDDLSPESLSLRFIELENALCNQDKLLCKFFHENKKLNLELESAFSEIASLRSVHDDMSAKPCDNCKMIMVNYADLWLLHSHVASLLDSARLELRELEAHSTLLGACMSRPVIRSNLEAAAVTSPRLNRINSILIPPSCNFFSGSPPAMNSGVKRACHGAISGWVTDREVSPSAQSEDKSAQKRLGLWFVGLGYDPR
jgi:hypothetical protein